MTFTPKAWGNFSTGGTPLNAAALIDLETRVTNYADGLVVGAVYYVDPAGSDSNSGRSVLAPWATINKINGQSFNVGDTILFKRGATWRTTTLVVPSPGMIFGAYGVGHDPILSGGSLVTGWTLSSGTTYSAGLASLPGLPPIVGYTVNNQTQILVAGTGSGSLTANQYFYSGGTLWVNLGDSQAPTGDVEVAQRQVVTNFANANLTFSGIDFRFGSNAAILIQNSTGHLFTGCSFRYTTQASGGYAGTLGINNGGAGSCRITNCVFDTLANDGIYINDTKGVEIDHCTLTNVGSIVGDQQSDGIQVENTYGTTPNSDGLWVHDNVIGEGAITPKGCIIINADLTIGGSASGIVERNTCKGGHFGVAAGATNLVIRNNVMTGQTDPNACGIYTQPGSDYTGVVITYNLIYGVDCGIFMDGSSNTRQVFIAHNTIVNAARQTLFFNSSMYGRIENNIAWNTSAHPVTTTMYVLAIAGGHTLVSDYNMFDTPYTHFMIFGASEYATLAAWQAGSGLDAHSFAGTDPLFNSSSTFDYTLSGSSPALNAGVVVPNITQVIVGAAPDIGYAEVTTSALVQMNGAFPVVRASGGDDTATFRSVISGLPATGGTILAPDPQYKIGSLVFPASPKDVTIIGSGLDATVFKQNATSIGSSIVSMFDASALGTIRLRDLTVDGNTTATTGLMRLVHSPGSGSTTGGLIDLERVRLTRYSYGVWSEDETVSCRDCVFDGGLGGVGIGTGATGVQHAFTGTGRLYLDNCYFTDNGVTGTNQHHGIYCANGIRVIARGTTFTRLWGTGFQAQHNGGSVSGVESKYTDCYFGVGATTNAAAGMATAANMILTLKNCTFDTPELAFFIQQNTKLNLLGCYFNGAASTGDINFTDTGIEVFADDCVFNCTAGSYQFYVFNNSGKLTVQNSRFTGATTYDVNVLAALTGGQYSFRNNTHTGATSGAYRFNSGTYATIDGNRFAGSYSDAAVRNNTSSTLGIINILTNDFSQASGTSVTLSAAPTLFKASNYGTVGYP